MAGKGDKNRTKDHGKYRSNYDKAFQRCDEGRTCEECTKTTLDKWTQIEAQPIIYPRPVIGKTEDKWGSVMIDGETFNFDTKGLTYKSKETKQ